MFINLYNQTIKVFFADVTPDMEDTRDELRVILHRAGMEIVDGRDVPSKELLDAMQQTDCSVHILGKTDIFEETFSRKMPIVRWQGSNIVPPKIFAPTVSRCSSGIHEAAKTAANTSTRCAATSRKISSIPIGRRQLYS